MPRLHVCWRPEYDDGLSLPQCDCERRFRHLDMEDAKALIAAGHAEWKKKRNASGKIIEDHNVLLLTAAKRWHNARTISENDIERAFGGMALTIQSRKYHVTRICAYDEITEAALVALGAKPRERQTR